MGTILILYFPVYITFFIVRTRKARSIDSQSAPSFITLGLYIVSIASAFMLIYFSLIVSSARSRWEPAKSDLASIATGHIAYYTENGEWPGTNGKSNVFNLIGWSSRSKTIYAYYCEGDIIPPTDKNYQFDYPQPDQDWPFSVKPEVSANGFTCMAVGNIDYDDDLDVWVINQQKIPIQLHDDGYIQTPLQRKSPIIISIMAVLVMVLIILLIWSSRSDGKRYKLLQDQE